MTAVYFLDGALEGMRLDFSRCPEYLRVGVGEDGASALSSLHDEPRDDEVIHVYRRLGRHRDSVGYAEADDFYASRLGRLDGDDTPGPDPELVYSNARWREAIAQHVRERKEADARARQQSQP